MSHVRFLPFVLGAFLLALLAGVGPSSGDQSTGAPAALGSDPAYSNVQPAAGDGSGTDNGVYLPPLAGPQSVITGTVLAPEESGPKAFYVATVDQSNHKRFFKGLTDADGHFKLKLPVIAGGVAALLLFRHFKTDGQPDDGAQCRVSDAPTQLENAQALAHVPSVGPAITQANSAYELGGQGQGLMQLQVRNIDPLRSKVLLDGSTRDVDTLASSDRSMVAKLHDSIGTGAHRASVVSNGQKSNDFNTIVVTQRFDPLGPLHTGSTQPVKLHIVGIRPQDAAVVIFNVGGAAELASGGHETRVPVKDGLATTDIRAMHPGQLLIQTILQVDLPDFHQQGENVGMPTPAPTQEGTTHEATPTPVGMRPPTETPVGLQPPTEPPPSIYGHVPELACKVEPLDGWFEPTQAVWQDDDAFPDQPTKQITKSAKFRPTPAYDAELKMVSQRDTALFGMEYYLSGGTRQSAPGRDIIAIEYRSNCSKPKDVHFVFTLEQSGVTVYPDPHKLQAYIVGPPNKNGAYHTYRLSINARGGIPPEGTTPFILDVGAYQFVAEIKLWGDNSSSRANPSSLRVIVYDSAVETHAPTLHFIPVVWQFKDDKHDYTALETKLKSDTDALAQSAHLALPDYYPVKNDDMPVAVAEIKHIEHSSANPNPVSYAYRILVGEIGGLVTGQGAMNGATFMVNERRVELVREIIVDDADSKAFTEHAGRAIVVMPMSMWSGLMLAGINGFYAGQKVIMVPQDTEHWEIAHELAHSIPLPGWDGGAADAECKRQYHNLQPTIKLVNGVNAYANLGIGERLRTNSAREGRKREDHVLHYFGATAIGAELWTDQCTYWHLLKNLQPPQDPPVLLVRGFLFNRPPGYAALLGPMYTYESSVDLTMRDHGRWSIVLRDEKGAELARYRFEPLWKFQNTNVVRDMMHFAYRIPVHAGMASVELDGPQGMLEVSRLSNSAPTVAITSPADGSTFAPGPGQVPVTWTASGQSGRPLFSSVLYSSDRGDNWLTSDHEIGEKNGGAPVYQQTRELWVKVIVSDGTRSSESSIVKLTVK